VFNLVTFLQKNSDNQYVTYKFIAEMGGVRKIDSESGSGSED